MTVTEQAQKIGLKLVRSFGGLQVEVVIQDVKVSYGTERYLVKVERQNSNAVWINA